MSEHDMTPMDDHTAPVDGNTDDPPTTDTVEVDLRQPPVPDYGMEAQYAQWLAGLHRTIGQEGVSRYDMEAYQTLRSTLLDNGVEVPPEAALEDFPPQAFFDERARVNVQVSQEGVMKTLIATIKAWIKKLTEYVQRLFKWVVKNLKSEHALKADIEARYNKVAILREHIAEVERKVKLNSEQTKAVNTAWHDLLMAKSTYQSQAFLGALGEGKPLQAFATASHQAADGAQYLGSAVEDLGAAVQRKQDDEIMTVALTENAHEAIKELSDVMRSVQEMVEIQPQKDYLVKHLSQRIPATGAWPKELTTTTPYQSLIDTYDYMYRQLRKINQVRNDHDYENVVKTVEDISNAADVMKTLVGQFELYNRVKFNALGVYYNFYSQYWKILVTAYKEQTIGDKKKEWVDKLHEKLSEKLSKVAR